MKNCCTGKNMGYRITTPAKKTKNICIEIKHNSGIPPSWVQQNSPQNRERGSYQHYDVRFVLSSFPVPEFDGCGLATVFVFCWIEKACSSKLNRQIMFLFLVYYSRDISDKCLMLVCLVAKV